MGWPSPAYESRPSAESADSIRRYRCGRRGYDATSPACLVCLLRCSSAAAIASRARPSRDRVEEALADSVSSIGQYGFFKKSGWLRRSVPQTFQRAVPPHYKPYSGNLRHLFPWSFEHTIPQNIDSYRHFFDNLVTYWYNTSYNEATLSWPSCCEPPGICSLGMISVHSILRCRPLALLLASCWQFRGCALPRTQADFACLRTHPSFPLRPFRGVPLCRSGVLQRGWSCHACP